MGRTTVSSFTFPLCSLDRFVFQWRENGLMWEDYPIGLSELIIFIAITNILSVLSVFMWHKVDIRAWQQIFKPWLIQGIQPYFSKSKWNFSLEPMIPKLGKISLCSVSIMTLNKRWEWLHISCGFTRFKRNCCPGSLRSLGQRDVTASVGPLVDSASQAQRKSSCRPSEVLPKRQLKETRSSPRNSELSDSEGLSRHQQPAREAMIFQREGTTPPWSKGQL